MITIEFDSGELDLLQEAMDKLTRSVGGDMAREKPPSDDTKYKVKQVIKLSEKIKRAGDAL